MKHETPEYTFDPKTESGMDINVEVIKEYADMYREQIKDYSFAQLLQEVSELQIDYDDHCPLGIRILDIIREGIERHLNRE